MKLNWRPRPRQQRRMSKAELRERIRASHERRRLRGAAPTRKDGGAVPSGAACLTDPSEST